MPADVFDEIQEIYDEASLKYAVLRPALGEAARGFEILYTPPVVNSPLMIIGLQPAGDKLPSPEPSGRRKWPSDNAYLRKPQFPLGKKLKEALGTDLLSKSVGMNCIFLTSKTESKYKTLAVDVLVRDFENFSLQKTRTLVRLLSPKCILFVGFSSQRRMTGRDFATCEVANADKLLLSSGDFQGIHSFAVRHLSGARPPPSSCELEMVGKRLRDHLAHLPVASS